MGIFSWFFKRTLFSGQEPEFNIGDRVCCLYYGDLNILEIESMKRLSPTGLDVGILDRVLIRDWHYRGELYECSIKDETGDCFRGKFLRNIEEYIPEFALISINSMRKGD